MKRYGLISVLALVLSGCGSDGRIGMDESPVWHKRTSTADKVKYFTPTCLEYGFERGTAEFKQCIADEIRISKSDASDQMDRVLANRPLTCNTYGRTTQCY